LHRFLCENHSNQVLQACADQTVGWRERHRRALAPRHAFARVPQCTHSSPARITTSWRPGKRPVTFGNPGGRAEAFIAIELCVLPRLAVPALGRAGAGAAPARCECEIQSGRARTRRSCAECRPSCMACRRSDSRRAVVRVDSRARAASPPRVPAVVGGRRVDVVFGSLELLAVGRRRA
jgi:hypothetical protein